MQRSNEAYEKNVRMDETVSLRFKQQILEGTQAFEQTPDADLYRVQLLSMMLERYDDYTANGADEQSACTYVLREFSNLRERMRGEGFEEYDSRKRNASAYPLLSEEEAAEYISQNAEKARRRASGFACLSASFVLMAIMIGMQEMRYINGNGVEMIGGLGAFAMIGAGLYTMITAKKPALEGKIRKGQFVLSRQLRNKLTELKEAAHEKARRGKKRGMTLLLMSPLVFVLGAALGAMLDSDGVSMALSMGGAFSMIGAGGYRLITAGAEKKAVNRILKH